MAHSFNRLHTRYTPEQAFDFISDFRHASLWDPRTRSVTLLSSVPIRQGSRFLLRAEFLGQQFDLPYEIVTFERPERLVLAGLTRFFDYREQVTFKADAGGTAIEYDATLSLRSWLALANPLLSLIYQRIADDATGGIVPALEKALQSSNEGYSSS